MLALNQAIMFLVEINNSEPDINSEARGINKLVMSNLIKFSELGISQWNEDSAHYSPYYDNMKIITLYIHYFQNNSDKKVSENIIVWNL